jgi:hypothetical protein
MGVQSLNEVVSKSKRRRIDLLLKKEINAPAMIMAGSDDEWTMPNVQAHFRAPSGLKIYMMILPCATSDTIIMRIMRQMLWQAPVEQLVECAGDRAALVEHGEVRRLWQVQAFPSALFAVFPQ